MSKDGIGQRVLITDRKHPHTGEYGEIVRFEVAKIIRKPAAVIKLDSGQECMVFDASHLQFL